MISSKQGKKNILNLGTNRPGYSIQFHPKKGRIDGKSG